MKRWLIALSVTAALLGVAGCSNDASRKRSQVARAGDVAGQNLVISPAPLDFGEIVGSAAKTVTFTNSGTTPVAISAVALCDGTTAEFSLTPVAPVTLAPGATQIQTVTYTPTANGPDSGCFTVSSDDPTAPSLQVALSATGFTMGACVQCHGNRADPVPALAPAPPLDSTGMATGMRVGAHQQHLRAGPYADPMTHSYAGYCVECHVYPPANVLLGGHPDAVENVDWGPLATHNGTLVPAFNSVTGTCSSTYCHGATLPGGTNKAPSWTTVDGTQAACGTCHGVPPPIAPHSAGMTSCDGCHAGYTPTSVNLATHVNGVVDAAGGPGGCTACHGDSTRPPAPVTGADITVAPPVDTAGNTATTAMGVGAHQAHLTGTMYRSQPIACTDCHAIPPGGTHPNGTVDFAWSELAKNGLPNTRFDAGTGVCSQVYCHGATLSGGSLGPLSLQGGPIWNKVDGTQAACGTCHGTPPLTPHPSNTNCGSCHPGYTTTSVNTASHINQTLELTGGGLSCTSCHGTAGRPAQPVTGADIAAAPPVDIHGNSATTAAGVGAHQSHLTGTGLRATPAACTDCHVVPTSTSHSNGVDDVTIGGWDPTTLKCSGVACHGGALAPAAGGTNRAPTWNVVDGSQKACGTCHDAPPTGVAPHTAGMASCDGCHFGYTPTSVNAAIHINGVKDVSATGCTACHGDANRPPQPVTGADIAPAPPVDTQGNSATTAPGVGAHQAHLAGTTLTASPIACTECHANPPVGTHPNGTMNFTWGPLATKDAAVPTFTAGANTCSNYCHGQTIGGGSNKNPVWTTVNGSQDACGTCHGNPPPSPHTSSMSCGGCHTGYTSSTVNKTVHIDGTLDVSGMTCSSCHGDSRRAAALAPAPPVDTNGNSATTNRGVGAHQPHLAGGTLRAPLSCSSCHAEPTSLAHANGTVEMAFGLIATARGAQATWNGTSCSNYCHGSTLGSGSNHAPLWTTVNGSQDACGTCHGDANGRPSTGRHTLDEHRRRACTDCHAGTASATSTIHVNGVVDLTPSLNWNPTSRSCDPSCHGRESWGGTAYTIPQTLNASPKTITFNAVTVGATVSQTVTIQNIGTSRLVVSGLALCAGTSSVFSLSSTAGFALDPSAAQTVTVSYTPAIPQTEAGCFTISSDDPAHGTTTVNLSGIGVSGVAVPVISPLPNPLDFGTVVNGSTVTKALIVSNTGSLPLSVTSIGVCAGSAAGFSVSPTTLSVPAGGMGTVNVTFTPSAMGAIAASCVSLASNDTSHTPFQVPITGTVAPPPVISTNPASLAFGAVTQNTSKSLTLNVVNTGGADLVVNAIQRCNGTSSEFSVSSSGGFTVAPGGSYPITVTYRPTGSSSDTGCIAIASNDAVHWPLNVSVSGSGASPSPAISATPNPLDFGSVASGSSKSLTLTVQNTGTATLNVSNVARCSGTSSEFSVSSSSFSLSPGSTRNLSVTYRPTSGGTDTGCIAFTSNDAAHNPYNVNVSGTGTVTPGTPSSISTSNRTSSGMTVSWSSATNAQTYELQRDTVNTFSSANLVTTPGLTGTSTSVTGLAAGTTYYFRVRAVSSTGTAGGWSPTASGATTAPVTPGTPSSISTSNRTASSMTVSWSSASNAQTYELQRDTVNTFSSANLVTTSGLTGTSTSVTGLAASTTYYFRVRAVSSTGTAGGWSPTASGATSSAPVVSTSPTSLAFGTVSRYTTKTLTLTVQNTGTATLNVSGVARCSNTSSEFSVSSSSFSLSPGATRNLSVSYRPSGSGTDSGCIAISSNDAAHNPLNVSVSGTGN